MFLGCSIPFLILIVQSLIGGACLWAMSGWTFPFTTDSIMYISTAVNIANHNGMVFSNIFVQPAFVDFLPMSLTPPGFPIAIAFLKWLGVNEYVAALVLPRACYLMLPFLFFSIFSRFLSSSLALFTSGVCALTFAILGCAVIAWTDIPYLALSLLTFSRLFKIFESEGGARWFDLVLVGVLSGVAFMFRYVGVSIILSALFMFVLMSLINRSTLRSLFLNLCLYSLGLLIVVSPYLIRNWIVFGDISMAPPAVTIDTFLSNMKLVVGYYLQGISVVIFGVKSFGLAIVLITLLLFTWLVVSLRRLISKYKIKLLCLLLLVMYFASYSLFVIFNKSQAFLPNNPDIDERLMIQVSWILVGGVIYSAAFFFKRMFISRAIAIIVVGCVLFTFILIQIFPAIKSFEKQSEIKNLSNVIGRYFPMDIPSNYAVVSNVPDIVSYFTNRNVRALANHTPQSLASNLSPYKDYIVLLLKKDLVNLSPAWRYDVQWLTPGGYIHIYSDKEVDVFFLDPKYKELIANEARVFKGKT